jgi:hypothetical protein
MGGSGPGDDIDDLWSELTHGGTIESAARFLCRWGSIDDVRAKAEELGSVS